MNLEEFNQLQDLVISNTAMKLGLMLKLNPAYNLEAGAAACIKNNPMLRAVSVSEILERVPR